MLCDMNKFWISVAWCGRDRQLVKQLCVAPGCTAADALELSGVMREIEERPSAMGIHGRILGRDGLPSANEYRMRPGDRLELYRPLMADPKELRRMRAKM